MKQVSSEVDRLARDRIFQTINQAGQQIERIVQKIIREQLKTFTKQKNIGKQNLAQVRRKLKSIIKRWDYESFIQ